MTAPIKPKAREDLPTIVLDGEAVIYDQAVDQLHHLNQTATLVLSMCVGKATIAELAREIAENFELPVEEVEPQVRALLRQLRRSGLLELNDSANGKVNGRVNGQVNGRRNGRRSDG